MEKFDSFKMESVYINREKGLFNFLEANKKKFKYSKKQEVLPDNFKIILSDEINERDPVFSRKIKDDVYLIEFQKRNKKFFYIWWLLADCGRSALRWTLWSILTPLIFAAVYHNIWFFSSGGFKTEIPLQISNSFFQFIYYSLVTFTTLGFGDITPTYVYLQIIVMLEVILGYVMLGGLISIFAVKLGRRS